MFRPLPIRGFRHCLHSLCAALIIFTLWPTPSSATRSPGLELDLRRVQRKGQRLVAPVRAGGTAELTLDPALQQAAQTLLNRAKPLTGAIVLLDIKTGQVLAWVGSRRGRASQSVLLTSRAPAASLFKIVTTAALIERGGIYGNRRVCSQGGQRRLERRHLEAPRRGTALCAPFRDALGHSRNAVYAQLAVQHLSRQELIEVAENFGFNRSLPFPAPIFTGGLQVPYNDLAFARTAAGFSNSSLSPLGAAHLAVIVANRGVAIRPQIIRSLNGAPVSTKRQTLWRALKAGTARALARMMEVTVHSGTSLNAFTNPRGQSYLGSVRVAGKTGTLQPTPRDPTTTWFVGFAPSRAPKVALSVLVQNGPVWHQKANHIARDVLRVYFARRGHRGIVDPIKESTD